MLSFLRPVLAIAKVTFSELLRDKVLYNTLLFSALLLSVGYFASKLMATDPTRMILDFGYSAVQISCQVVALFLTANLIIREFDRRTVFLALSRPLSRGQFLLGKYLGIAFLLFVNWFLLVGAFVLILKIIAYGVSDERFSILFTDTLIWGLAFGLMQSFMVSALVLMFSTFATASLSVLYTVGLLMVGNNVTNIKFMAVKIETPSVREAVQRFAHLIPNFEFFHLGTKITYGLPLAPGYAAHAVLYAFIQIAFFLFLASLLIHRKDA